MFSSYFKFFLIIFLILILFLPHLFIPILATNAQNLKLPNDIQNKEIYEINSSSLVWPIPGYTYISSPFGKRKSPTSGASNYHLGIDIPAPSGTYLIAPMNAIVTFIGFKGSGGYTIILQSENLEFTYHHVSPQYIIQVNAMVSKGQLIGQVGPKNVYGILNNPYKDSNGNPTNGATTGPHLHFAIKKDGQAVNPLNYFL